MMVQVLAPGMEHRQKADPRAQMLRVGADLPAGFRPRRGTVCRKRIRWFWSASGLSVWGSVKTDMKVLDRQELRLALFEPSRAGRAPALRAMAITAGAVGDRSLAALVALFDVAAERGSSAERNIAKGALLLI